MVTSASDVMDDVTDMLIGAGFPYDDEEWDLDDILQALRICRLKPLQDPKTWYYRDSRFACVREWDDNEDDPGWQCLNDHTACMWNNGHNTCGHPGVSLFPLLAKGPGRLEE